MWISIHLINLSSLAFNLQLEVKRLKVSPLRALQGPTEAANQEHQLLGLLEAEPEHQQEEGLGTHAWCSVSFDTMAAHVACHRRYNRIS